MVCPVGCVVFLQRTKKKFRRNKFLGLQQKKCAHRQGRDLTSCDLFYFSKKKIVFEKFFLFQAIFMSPKKKSAHRQGGGGAAAILKIAQSMFSKDFFHFKRSHLRQLKQKKKKNFHRCQGGSAAILKNAQSMFSKDFFPFQAISFASINKINKEKVPSMPVTVSCDLLFYNRKCFKKFLYYMRLFKCVQYHLKNNFFPSK